MQEIFTAIILSVIQGVLEFLPVSSSAHFLSFANNIANINKEEAKFFAEFATFLVTLNYFKSIIIGHIVGVFQKEKNSFSFFFKIIIASIPAFFIFIFFKNIFNIGNIAIFLILGSLLMIFAEVIFFLTKNKQKTINLNEVTFKQAFFIGLIQVFSGFSGFSRSGSTISSALICGFSRSLSITFSFLISLPITFASIGYSAFKINPSINFINIFIFILTFLIASFAIKICFKVLNKYNLIYFAIYRILLSYII